MEDSHLKVEKSALGPRLRLLYMYSNTKRLIIKSWFTKQCQNRGMPWLQYLDLCCLKPLSSSVLSAEQKWAFITNQTNKKYNIWRCWDYTVNLVQTINITVCLFIKHLLFPTQPSLFSLLENTACVIQAARWRLSIEVSCTFPDPL